MTLQELSEIEGWTIEHLTGNIAGSTYVYTGFDVPTNVYRLSDYKVSSRSGPGIWFIPVK